MVVVPESKFVTIGGWIRSVETPPLLCSGRADEPFDAG